MQTPTHLLFPPELMPCFAVRPLSAQTTHCYLMGWC